MTQRQWNIAKYVEQRERRQYQMEKQREDRQENDNQSEVLVRNE